MKKYILTMFFLTYSCVVFSQIFKFGVRAGVNISTLHSEDFTSGQLTLSSVADNTIGFHAGVFARIKLPLLPILIQPEVLFSSIGGKLAAKDGSTDKTVSQTYNRLDIPVMVGLKFGMVRLQLGPIGSILLSQKTNLSEFNIEQEFNKMTIGYQAGIGVDLLGTIAIDVKYEGNLSKLGTGGKLSSNNTNIEFDSRLSQFLLSVGYFF